jgi:hypothetical protein
MTGRNSLNRQTKTFKKSVFDKGLLGIFRTGGLVPTSIWQKGRDETLVQTY